MVRRIYKKKQTNMIKERYTRRSSPSRPHCAHEYDDERQTTLAPPIAHRQRCTRERLLREPTESHHTPFERVAVVRPANYSIILFTISVKF